MNMEVGASFISEVVAAQFVSPMITIGSSVYAMGAANMTLTRAQESLLQKREQLEPHGSNSFSGLLVDASSQLSHPTLHLAPCGVKIIMGQGKHGGPTMSGIPTTQSGRVDRNKRNRSMSAQMRKTELQVRPVLFEREQHFAITQPPVLGKVQVKRCGKQYQDVLSVVPHLLEVSLGLALKP